MKLRTVIEDALDWAADASLCTVDAREMRPLPAEAASPSVGTRHAHRRPAEDTDDDTDGTR